MVWRRGMHGVNRERFSRVSCVYAHLIRCPCLCSHAMLCGTSLIARVDASLCLVPFVITVITV